MQGRYVVGKLYRAGPHGVSITWRDGTTTAYPARALLTLDQAPRRIDGRLYRALRGNQVQYEAPTMIPEP